MRGHIEARSPRGTVACRLSEPAAHVRVRACSRSMIRRSPRHVRRPTWTAPDCSTRRSGSGGRSGSRAWPSTSARRSITPARLSLVEIGDREQVRAAGEAIFVRRRDDRAIYDAVFARWWRQRGAARATSRRRPSSDRPRATSTARRRPARPSRWPASRAADAPRRRRGNPIPTSGEDDTRSRTRTSRAWSSPDAYSRGEMLRHREFDRMTPAELRDAERLVDQLIPRLEQRRTRRYQLHSHGRRLSNTQLNQ